VTVDLTNGKTADDRAPTASRPMLGGIAAALTIVAALPTAAHPQAPAAADAAFVRQTYTKHEYRIPMRDGARLFTVVYVPKDVSPANRYPIMIQRTPFSVAPYGTDAYARTLGPNPFMMREKYVFVYQDVRGRYMSEGEFVNVRPFIPDSIKALNPKAVDEASDTYDTIDWLLRNVPANNGKVGQWGISYAGFYASLGTLSRHPALVASSPQAPVTDLFFEDFHHNGALTQAYFYAYPIFGILRPNGPTTDNWWLPVYQKMTSLGLADDYAYQLSLGPLANTTERFYKDNLFWRDIIDHPNYDEFWQTRAVPPVLRSVKHAVLVVGGWFDAEDLYGPLAVYKTLEKRDPDAKVSLIMGPFGHRGWAAPNVVHTVHGDLYFGDSLATRYQRDVETPFFRAYLKGIGLPAPPGALMFDTGRKTWRRFARWPAPGAIARTYYFHHDGSLSSSRPAEVRAFREYASDPQKPVPARCTGPTIEDFTLNRYMSDDQRCFTVRPDVLTFQTAPLRADVTVGGELTARLTVSTTGTDADFVVKLIDVYPADTPDGPYQPNKAVHMGGYEQMVRGEIMRGRFRTSFAAPESFQPSQPTAVGFRLQDVLHTFSKGHRIMVQVQSSWFPAFDRNPQQYVPNIYQAKARDFIAATQRVWMDHEAPSGLEVQVLP
jgi:putative CocE/NonD family hydrolase